MYIAVYSIFWIFWCWKTRVTWAYKWILGFEACCYKKGIAAVRAAWGLRRCHRKQRRRGWGGCGLWLLRIRDIRMCRPDIGPFISQQTLSWPFGWEWLYRLGFQNNNLLDSSSSQGQGRWAVRWSASSWRGCCQSIFSGRTCIGWLSTTWIPNKYDRNFHQDTRCPYFIFHLIFHHMSSFVQRANLSYLVSKRLYAEWWASLSVQCEACKTPMGQWAAGSQGAQHPDDQLCFGQCRKDGKLRKGCGCSRYFHRLMYKR